MIEREVPYSVRALGISETLFTVFAQVGLERWELDHCSRPSHRRETKMSKPTVEVYNGSH